MVTIFVCVSCRRPVEGSAEGFDQPGVALVDSLRRHFAANGRGDATVEPVDCLAVCERPCTVAFAGAGKWTYLIGDLDPLLHAEEVAGAAASFAAAENGIIPWRERPMSFRKGVIARVPPLASATSNLSAPEPDR